VRAFDVAVVGGGPAGAAVALGLAAAGHSVIVLGRPDPTGGRAGEVLSPEIGSLLVQLGVWDRFLASGPQPAHAIWSSWGSDRLVAKEFILNPHGPGWRVDRPAFDAMLLAAAEQAGAGLQLGLRRIDVERAGAQWRITAAGAGDEPTTVASRFVIDATGRRAAVARASGARWLERDSLVALIATLGARADLAMPHEDVLLVEAAPKGWWYSSIVPGGELVATFVTDVDLVRDHRDTPAALWSCALGEASFTPLRVAGFERRDLQVRRVGVGRLDRAAGPGWIAVGDAAATIDPLSGAGITRALQSAVRAVDAVGAALAGDPSALGTYAEHAATEFDASLRTGAGYYHSERRWPDSPFWQRRQKQPRPGGPPWPTTSPKETYPTSAAASRRSIPRSASSAG